MSPASKHINYLFGATAGATIGYFSGVVIKDKYKIHLFVIGAVIGAILYNEYKTSENERKAN